MLFSQNHLHAFVTIVCLCTHPGPPLAAQKDVYFLPDDRVSIREMRAVPAVELAPGIRVHTVVAATGSFSLADFDSGTAAPLHHHAREQADVGLTGALAMTLGTHVEALGPGAGVIVPPNVAHSIANKGSGMMTVIEFHTVRRPDMVPPRPALTFPASPTPAPVPDDRPLVVQLEAQQSESGNDSRTLRGETCTLVWRRLARGGAADLRRARARTELFVYMVRGDAEVTAAGTVTRVSGGTLVVIPGNDQHARIRAVGSAGAIVVEFSPSVAQRGA